MAEPTGDSWRDRVQDITDERFQELRQAARPYTVVILKAGPRRWMDGVDQVIYRHGRRNMSLRVSGLMPIVCPIADGSDVCGVSVFHAEPEVVEEIMAEDPGVQLGVFTYEVHRARSFPGATLPA